MKINEAYHQFLHEYISSEYVNDIVIRIILMHANNIFDMNEYFLKLEEECQNLEKIKENLKRIDMGEPYQYILKEAGFNGALYYVDSRVLIPRMETEELLLEVNKYLKNHKVDALGDIGTGSGCIAIEIKKDNENVDVFASDISSEAIEVASINAQKQNVKISFLNGDMLEPFIKNNIKLDVIVSNPPYISNKKEVDSSVKKHEPSLALYAKHGIDNYETILKRHKEVMNSHGAIFFEFNYDQKDALEELINKYVESPSITFFKDISNKWRYVKIVF